MDSLVDLAYSIALKAHEGQVDKGGIAYINHPVSVASFVDSDDEKVVALLHDVVEDTDINLNDLQELGIPRYLVEAIDCMTRRSNEERMAYLLRVKGNAIAKKVKIADLKHNSDISRIPFPREKDFNRVREYGEELAFLKEDSL
ncbi:MAG: HD domain-containing protein [Erysipelotrichaceae bacterium]